MKRTLDEGELEKKKEKYNFPQAKHFPSLLSVEPSDWTSNIPEVCMKEIFLYCSLEDQVHVISVLSKRCRKTILTSNQFWKNMLFRFYEEKPVEEIEENYYKKYLKLMKNYERVFSFQMDGVPLGESDGAFDLTIDFFGNASWDGFGEGCGRAGEDYAKNKISGKGQLYFTKSNEPRVKGKETVIWGYYPWIKKKKHQKIG